MEEQGELFFELKCNGDSIIISLSSHQAHWSEGWLKGCITIKAGAFQGTYEGEFALIDFISFRKELQYLYLNLNGTAKLNCLEDPLKINIKGDGLGHLHAICEASDQSKYDSWRVLTFDLNFDQTYIPALLRQLDEIMEAFPVTK